MENFRGKTKIRFFLLILITPIVLFGFNQADEKKYKNGKAIYEQTCVSCHGIDGKTNQNMKLVVKPRKLSNTILTQEQSIKIISEGAHFWGARADIMPAWKYVYTPQQIGDVALYISKAFNPNRDDKVKKLMDESTSIIDIEDKKIFQYGEKIFKRNCSLCHGISGNAESEYVEKSKASNVFIYPYNLTRTLLSEEQIFLYVKFGGKYWGTHKNDMPSWKKKYNDIKLKSVAKYVKQNIVKTK